MERFKSKKHLELVAYHKCCLSHTNTCGGGVQAHHLLKPWSGKRGMGMKADDKNAIPLCYKHHAELHDKIGDEHKFFMKYNLPSYYGELVAVWFWYMSPHRSI